MSDFISLTPQNSSDLDDDLINKLFISGSILPFNKDDLIDTNTILGFSQFEVKQYRYKSTGLDMAVKRFPILRKRGWNDKNKYVEKLIKEAKILSQLKHSNDIVEFYGLCFGRDYALLCMELMEMNLSELNGIILRYDAYCPDELLPYIVVPIIDGLEYCHKKNIIHRDIKPSNILINRSGKIKIGDFSESRVLNATTTGDFNGTIYYWSPERVKFTEVKDPKYDIWGLGITLLEFICGFRPYQKLLGQNPNMIALIQFIENIDPETLLNCAHIHIDEDKRYYADVLKLIHSCLKRIDERATIDELKNTSYYKNAQEKCRRDKSGIKHSCEHYDKMNRIVFEENSNTFNTLLFEENSRRYNFDYLELKFRLLLSQKSKHKLHICYHTHTDKWILLKNYIKSSSNIKFMSHELTILHKFEGQPFIPKFYGWGSIELNKRSNYVICIEVMDMDLAQFYGHFINNFGFEDFEHALSEGILGHISCVVLNALLEIHKRGFALHNINSKNILLNDCGEIKLCGFTCARKREEKEEWTSNLYKYYLLGLHDNQNLHCPTYPSDVWSYAATLIEFAWGGPPSCFKKLHDSHPRLRIFTEEEIELKKMSKSCSSIGYFAQAQEFFIECMKLRVESNFDILIKMGFYQEALKNIEENKTRLAKWVQAIIIEETRDTVPVQWFHKFMDPENAKIYDASKDFHGSPT